MSLPFVPKIRANIFQLESLVSGSVFEKLKKKQVINLRVESEEKITGSGRIGSSLNFRVQNTATTLISAQFYLKGNDNPVLA